MIKDKKYSILLSIGVILIFISVLFGEYFPTEIGFGLLGFSIGWITAVWTLKMLILREGIKELSLKKSKIEKELNLE